MLTLPGAVIVVVLVLMAVGAWQLTRDATRRSDGTVYRHVIGTIHR